MLFCFEMNMLLRKSFILGPTRYMNPSYRLLKPATVMREHLEGNTVVFPGTVIAKSFVKQQITHRFISRVLLANANALAAAAMPEVEKTEDLYVSLF